MSAIFPSSLCVCVYTCVSSVCVRASGQHLFCRVTTKGGPHVHRAVCVKTCVNRGIASGSLEGAGRECFRGQKETLSVAAVSSVTDYSSALFSLSFCFN